MPAGENRQRINRLGPAAYGPASRCVGRLSIHVYSHTDSIWVWPRKRTLRDSGHHDRPDGLRSGRANGAPFLGGGGSRGAPARRRRQQRWAQVMNAEYRALQRRLALGESGLIDPYGATDPAEFFAVVSEVFFERPDALAEQHPALFEEMRRCYRLDPRSL